MVTCWTPFLSYLFLFESLIQAIPDVSNSLVVVTFAGQRLLVQHRPLRGVDLEEEVPSEVAPLQSLEEEVVPPVQLVDAKEGVPPRVDEDHGVVDGGGVGHQGQLEFQTLFP